MTDHKIGDTVVFDTGKRGVIRRINSSRLKAYNVELRPGFGGTYGFWEFRALHPWEASFDLIGLDRLDLLVVAERACAALQGIAVSYASAADAGTDAAYAHDEMINRARAAMVSVLAFVGERRPNCPECQAVHGTPHATWCPNDSGPSDTRPKGTPNPSA